MANDCQVPRVRSAMCFSHVGSAVSIHSSYTGLSCSLARGTHIARERTVTTCWAELIGMTVDEYQLDIPDSGMGNSEG